MGYVNDVLLRQTDGQELPGRLYKRPAGREREGAFWNTINITHATSSVFVS